MIFLESVFLVVELASLSCKKKKKKFIFDLIILVLHMSMLEYTILEYCMFSEMDAGSFAGKARPFPRELVLSGTHGVQMINTKS